MLTLVQNNLLNTLNSLSYKEGMTIDQTKGLNLRKMLSDSN